MNESENDFEPLRRLLAIKRHEIPPPGYFNNFPGQVVARLRAGDTGAPEGITAPSWLLKFFRAFEAKPAYVSSFACSLCLLLLFGIVYAERPDATEKPSLFTAFVAPSAALVDAKSADYASAQTTGLMINTNPVLSLQPVAALFNQQNPLAQVQAMNVNLQSLGN